MEKRKFFLLNVLTILSLAIFLSWNLPSEALARAGLGQSGGESSGSQGVRSTKQVQALKTTVQPTKPSRTGLAKTTATTRVNSSASKSTDSSGSESAGSYLFGLIGLILLGILGGFIYWLITRRRRQQTGDLQGSQPSNPVENGLPSDYEPEPPPPDEPEWDLEKGLTCIEQADPLFSQEKFKDQALDYFFKIQGAWVDRDLSTVKHLLTGEMFDLLQEDAEKMRRDGLVNQLQNLAVREVNLSEAWQDSGQDYLTVRIHVTLLDYTLNEQTGEIVSGSKLDPIQFEEYWTFTRPVGNNPWQLSAVTQAE